MMKNCKWCGCRNASEAKFCTACGRKFNKNKRMYIILGSLAVCLAVIAALTFLVLGKSMKNGETREQAQKIADETEADTSSANEKTTAGATDPETAPETKGTDSVHGDTADGQMSDMDIEPAYAEIIEKYKAGVSQGWGMQEYAAAGLCYLFGYYSDTSLPGFALMDINNDGVEELLIGEINLPSVYMGMFYEMYTVTDGQVTLVATSQERDRYYLCADNEIGNEGSGSAFNSIFAYYNLEGGGLSLIEAVIFDGTYDQDSPWFYSITGLTEDSYIPVTEGEADRIRQSHEYVDITFTPLSEFGN